MMTVASTKTQAAPAQTVRQSSTGWMIKMLSMRLDNEMKKELMPLGLTLDHFKIMMTLLEKDHITQSQIGEKIMMPAYGLTRNLDKLEADGYLKRDKHHSSRRSHSICLTSSGKQLAPKLFSSVKIVNEKLLSSLNNNESKGFNQILKKLLNSTSGLS